MKARIIKFLSVIFISLITLNSLSSCETTYAATTTDDMYSTSYYDDAVTVNIIMEYGTPYYIDGILQYYLYRNLYYYPYYYNNVMYFRSFYRPLPPRHHYNFGRPHRGDLRFGHHRPDGHRPNGHNPGHIPEHKPNPGHNPGHSNHNPNVDRHHNVQPQHGNSNQRFGNSRPNMNRQTIPNRTTPSIGSGMSFSDTLELNYGHSGYNFYCPSLGCCRFGYIDQSNYANIESVCQAIGYNGGAELDYGYIAGYPTTSTRQIKCVASEFSCDYGFLQIPTDNVNVDMVEHDINSAQVVNIY